MRILVLHGPNLNTLGQREPALYGEKTLPEINTLLEERARELGLDLKTFQSNSEGVLIDFLQAEAAAADGLIINPGALTHYGLSLRDCLAALSIPIIEVHLTNIYAREDFRRQSVIAEVATGQISGLGWRSYLLGLEAVVGLARDEVGHGGQSSRSKQRKRSK